jgi:DNA-binding transcriptional MocR family regulator
MARGGNKTGRNKPKFVQVFEWMMITEAWAAMPSGPRALYLELKRHFNGHNNGSVFLSHRDAAKALAVHRNTIGPWFRVLEQHGFIAMTRGPHLGPSGVGIAATWALTELATSDGKRATMDFKKFKSPAQKPCKASTKTVHPKPCQITHAQNL